MELNYNGYTFPIFCTLNRDQLYNFKQAIGAIRQDELEKKGECLICIRGDMEYWGRKLSKDNYSVASRVIMQKHEEIM